MPDSSETFARYLEELATVLRTMDPDEVDEFRRRLNPWALPVSGPGRLIGMHKARAACPVLTEAERAESLEWLRRHGFKPLPKR
jgi:hypothetical protein